VTSLLNTVADRAVRGCKTLALWTCQVSPLLSCKMSVGGELKLLILNSDILWDGTLQTRGRKLNPAAWVCLAAHVKL
jgi:hypothetical protein